MNVHCMDIIDSLKCENTFFEIQNLEKGLLNRYSFGMYSMREFNELTSKLVEKAKLIKA